MRGVLVNRSRSGGRKEAKNMRKKGKIIRTMIKQTLIGITDFNFINFLKFYIFIRWSHDDYFPSYSIAIIYSFESE